MNIHRILFPSDFSRYNDAALAFASTLAAENDAELHVVHVDDMHDLNAPLATSGPYDSTIEMWDRSKVHKRLEKIAPSVDSVRHTHQYLEGKPVDEIVNYAKRENINLIVMSSHGRTGLQRLLMGSVAEGVMRRAKCPVLIIKQPAEQPRVLDVSCSAFANNDE